MLAHHLMKRDTITVNPQTPIVEAADLMLRSHVSGLPVVDRSGALVGVVSQSDFLRRSEIGTQRHRPRWLQFLIGPSRLAADFVHEQGRRVQDVMTPDPVTVEEDTGLEEMVRLMEKHAIHRLPVIRKGALVGIVTRSDLLRAVVSVARELPSPALEDDQIRDRILSTINGMPWKPDRLQAMVRHGVVHLYGVVFDEAARRAAVIAAENTPGVTEVHDLIYTVDARWNDMHRM